MGKRWARGLLVAVVAVGLLTAACGGGGGSDDEGDGGGGGGSSIEVSASEFTFSSTALEATAGDVGVSIENTGNIEHDFSIDGQNLVIAAGPGQTAAGTYVLEPGEYTFFCSVAGHREAGMEGTLTVS